MSERRPKLFLSSTRDDLADFREVAIHVCQRLGIDVIAMEDFGPDPRAAAAVCQAKIEQADLFLGLYAYRYGFTPEGFDGVSITQLEYEWATQRQPSPPVLLFLVDENLPWLPSRIDDGAAKERLRQFKERVRKHHTVSKLTTPEQLKEELFLHLPKFRDRTRDDALPAAAVLPLPPEPYVAHQYTLLQTSQVIGREAELQTLARWAGDVASEFSAARLLCVVAIGGMGKSALTWKWFHHRASQAMPTLAGRFWWSFYESDAGFDRFVTTALAYCSGRAPEAVAKLSVVDRETELLALLDRQPFLLVLDGLERVLIAYSNLDFAHLADEELDSRTANAVAGARGLPQEAGSSFIGQHRLRKTIDPRVGTFLRKLAHVRAARILVTTRLYPSELQTETGHEIPGTAAWFLRGMTPEDALSLWRAMRVSGTDAELAKLFATIDHYPLLIRALAGEVARYRRAPGHFDTWRRSHADFDPFSLPLVQAKSHVLAHALGDLKADAREVLHTIAAFRSPVGYDTVAALFLERKGWAEEKLDELLTELEDRGLLGWNRRANQYDLHPIVRGVVWRELDDRERSEVYEALERHFSAVPQKPEGVETLAEASPVIELFTALVGLGRYDDAASVYFERLHFQFSFAKSGLQQVNIGLLESFFADGLERPPRTRSHNASVLFQLGHAYKAIGRLVEGHSFYRRALASCGTDKRISAHGYLSESAYAMGRLQEALREARISAGDPDAENHERLIAHLSRCEAAVGNVQSALRRLHGRELREIDSNWHLAQIHLWNSSYEKAAKIAEFKGLTTVLTEAWMNLGRADLVSGMLLDVLRDARAQSFVETELKALRILAELHRRTGDPDQSRVYLDDLAEPAARGPYRLIQTDAANVRAELERDLGHRDAAVAAAEEAYRLAWCDGPPFAYHWGLEHAKRLLSELGAAVPKL